MVSRKVTMSDYKILVSETELKWFFDNVMPPLESNEVYFLSLSARNKLLTEEQKERIQLGRTEMFERRIVRKSEWARLLRTIRKFETAHGSYTTKNNSAIPETAIVCYLNVNPSDILKAYNEFTHVMNDYMFELSQCAFHKKDTTNIMYRISKQDVLLMNCYQKAKGTRHWLDFDFDVPKNEKTLSVVYQLVYAVQNRNGRAYIIETRGGYHVLIHKTTEFDKSFNPSTIAKDYYAMMLSVTPEYKENIEVIQNKNQMIPLPGTLHYDTMVSVLNKD